MNLRLLEKYLLVALPLSLVFFPPCSRAQESHPPHWTYAGEDGPNRWAKLDPAYSACSTGHAQSPINIQGAKKADLPALQFHYSSAPLNIVDNGHTIQINYAPGSSLVVGDQTYTLKQFHFHHPAEEHINGKHFDLVAHLVHADKDGHLGVVAILFKEGEATNVLIETLWKNIPVEKGKAVDAPAVIIDLTNLLPVYTGYYTFPGSLTTPPCTEGVTWYVLKTNGELSKKQLETFAQLYPRDARPIQPTNHRNVLETKQSHFFRRGVATLRPCFT